MANAVSVVQKPCAACKHQCRRCDANCELAKYFPAEKADDFEDVYHLYGMQNTLKILKSVDEEERDKMIESLTMKAKMRLEYLVHGLISIARKLSIEIDKAKEELEFVCRRIQLFRRSDNRASPSTREGQPGQP